VLGMRFRRVPVTAAALVALAAASGCSNREAPANKQAHNGTATASPGADGVQQVTITSGVDLRFHPSTIVVHPGKVRVVLANTAKPGAGPPHNLLVNGLPGVFIGTTVAGAHQSVTFTAPAPGEYSFVCTIHAAQNQTGKLIVR
jgi:plastocyanin